MPFSFSSSASAVFVGSATANSRGTTSGWAYKRESYSNANGSGVRTTKQKLGEAPVTQVRMYDAQGRPLLVEGNAASTARSASAQDQSRNTVGRRIEDVTEDDGEGQSRRGTTQGQS